MSINKAILKEVLLDNQKDIESYKVCPRNYALDDFAAQVFVGVRRCGKSFLLFQKIRQLLAKGHKWDEMLYLDFEDSRLEGFTKDDFNLILECHAEIYQTRPMLFLDEIQNIEGWQKFARNLADRKYEIYITGSNAKMLSKDIMSQLGGRYLPKEVYPLSFKEYLDFTKTGWDNKALLATESRSKFMQAYHEYFRWGGLPESVGLAVKRNYLTSTYQKIYLGDIVARNNISNPKLLHLMLKKMAESIMQPISYTRLAQVLSSVSGKVSVPTISNYISFAEDAWLILRLRNIKTSFSEKESVCKYYFIDNGLLSLQLINAETILLENLVALSLFRKYGHDQDNERVFFYKDNIEVDFYIPEDELAIQASYSVNDEFTQSREVEALSKLPKYYSCKRRIILTYDESRTIEDKYGTIEVIPAWKWLLQN